jgi:hypothetical protein
MAAMRHHPPEGPTMNPKPADPTPPDNDPPLQGEGNYSAARRYDKAQREFVKAGKVDQAADKAKPETAREEQEMSDAEKAGRDKARR